MERKRIDLPPKTTLKGKVTTGQQITVMKGGKPPKRRFLPGQHVVLNGEHYDILYMYRLQDNPNEWLYCLEERPDVERKDDTRVALEQLDPGSETPRVVYDLFMNFMDVQLFFSDIPRWHSSITATNQEMVQGAQVVPD
jgi:hypothetical protein